MNAVLSSISLFAVVAIGLAASTAVASENAEFKRRSARCSWRPEAFAKVIDRFGKGLVQTPNDFGTRGLRPTHPVLLDWLAAEFVACGWSIKAMHRKIMLSAVYRQASSLEFAGNRCSGTVRDGFGWQCLVARRLVERGVRFVELIHTGSSGNWDSHGNMADHGRLAKQVDRPMAGLIHDLKTVGLFDDGLVVWTTEFGRTPFNNSAANPGREHHNWAFSSWLAGVGVKRGYVHGATDEHGIRAVEKPVHVHDFHATILHLLGLDHTKLTYRHAGRDYRLTDVHGEVVKEILA